MRKVYIELKVKLIMNLEDGVEVSNAIDEMDYIFNLEDEHGEMVDTEILDYEILDSK
jgi:hypothetical protein